MKLVVITPVLLGSAEAILSNLLRILEASCSEIFVITSGYKTQPLDKKMHIKNYRERGEENFGKLFEYVILPVKTCFEIVRLSKEVGTTIFLLGNINLLLPIITAKLMRKRVILVLTGLHSEAAKWILKDKLLSRVILHRLFRALEEINFTLVDQIIGYSESNIAQFNLAKYKDKFSYGGSRFVDIELFKLTRDINEREKTVGYIGRFREEKGLVNFLDAIPLLLKKGSDIDFMIGGDGPLHSEVAQRIRDYPSGRISSTGWIQHDQLPEYLSRLKLLVIPSYSETGPYIAVEAMACGTPVLSTSVGFIPDIIKDEETGFILENNSPECIAQNIERALNYPYLDQVVRRARDFVEQNYSLEAAVERYKEIIHGEQDQPA